MKMTKGICAIKAFSLNLVLSGILAFSAGHPLNAAPARIARHDTIYVDLLLFANHGVHATSTYDTATRSNTGGDAKCWDSVKNAIGNMTAGDLIQMRGGIYQQGAIDIPPSKNAGTRNGFDTLWSGIESYPGEWAILDGQNTIAYTGDPKGVLGHYCGSTYECETKYWTFQRFEIRNGRSYDDKQAIGLYVSGGPYIARYLIFRNNCISGNPNGISPHPAGNNPSGLRSYRPDGCVVEYCYFKGNGGAWRGADNNCAQLQFFSDYKWAGDTIFDTAHVTKRNVVRYCFFDSAFGAIKHKGIQLLADYHNGADTRFIAQGDQFHHNVIKRTSQPILTNSDMTQIHHNVIDTGWCYPSSIASNYADRLHVGFYNNTLRHANVTQGYGYERIPNPFHPYYFACNNILDSSNITTDGGIFAIGYLRPGDTQTVNLADCPVKRNIISRPLGAAHFSVGGNSSDSCMGNLTVSQFSGCYSYANWLKTNPSFFPSDTGLKRFVPDSSYVLNGDTTIYNGGIGGTNPASGEPVPNYIGAVRGTDTLWLHTVMYNLADTNFMKWGGVSEANTLLPRGETVAEYSSKVRFLRKGNTITAVIPRNSAGFPGKTRFDMYDARGRAVFGRSIETGGTTSLSVGNLTQGIYFGKLTCGSNQVISRITIVK